MLDANQWKLYIICVIRHFGYAVRICKVMYGTARYGYTRQGKARNQWKLHIIYVRHSSVAPLFAVWIFTSDDKFMGQIIGLKSGYDWFNSNSIQMIRFDNTRNDDIEYGKETSKMWICWFNSNSIQIRYEVL